MEDLKLYDMAEQYADFFIHSADFQRFLALGKEIEKKLSKEIIAFQTARSQYEEMKKYEPYQSAESYRKKLRDTKEKLYSHPLMTEYKRLENQLQEKLNADWNELKQWVSNKFELTKF